MSDRPMRLKYLTKMKIILCIFLLYITAVSVFGQSVELNSVVGGSVKFPAAVKIEGNLRYSGKVAPIGVVTSGRFTTPRDGRLQWDSSTGLFYLSGLRVEDSGIYTVQDTQQTPVSTFNLTVWEDNVPVSKPHLNVTRNEYPCTLLCTVERGTGVTLTLYKNSEKKPYVTSPVRSYPHLDMTVPVESGTYTCEAKNSVSRETSDPLTVGAHCTAPSSPSAGTIVAIFIAVVAVLFAVVFAVLYWRIRTKHAVLKTSIQDEQATLQDGSKTEMQAVQTEMQGSKTEMQAVQTEMQVLKTSIQVLPARLQDAVQTEIQGSKTEMQALKTEIQALKTSIQGEQAALQDVVRKTIQGEQVALQDVVRKTIQVQKLIDSLVPPASGEQAALQDVVRKTIQGEQVALQDVQKLIDSLVPPASGEQAALQDAARVIFVAVRGIILDKIMSGLPPDVRDLINSSNAPKTMTSSHPTAYAPAGGKH